tara:strand:+ start:320 stop:517 length:198 start_codon:yes stop_codon:yes gene_type:complete
MKCKIKYPHDFIDYPCEICHPELKGINEHRELFIARATKKIDTKEIRNEAIEKFNEANGLNEMYR